MDFSNRLKELREKRGLSQEKLSEELDIPRSTLARYENGYQDVLPRKQRIYEIADYFGVTVDYLIGRTDEEQQLTEHEEEFLKDSIKLTVKELQEKYELSVDGKPATKEEIEGAMAFIRSLRDLKK
jgi:transcriptional regulator with XRE-family HTH domain